MIGSIYTYYEKTSFLQLSWSPLGLCLLTLIVCLLKALEWVASKLVVCSLEIITHPSPITDLSMRSRQPSQREAPFQNNIEKSGPVRWLNLEDWIRMKLIPVFPGKHF
jgi:hypothetical protein